jgi:septal ring factor EnvC (AmiA/AmiB activator)
MTTVSPRIALLGIVLLAAFMLPGAAVAQGTADAAHINGRLGELQRTLAALSTQLEQLKAQNQQLQQRLEKMQASIGQRLDRLEKAPAPKPAAKPVPRSGTPKQ